MKKRECQRRNIEPPRDEGQITLLTSLFFLLFFSVLLVGWLQMEMVRSSAGYLEDALAASGLACALIDLREYGVSHSVRIADVKEAYEQYCRSLKSNLGLDEAWQCENKRLIFGRVTLEEYYVYNVNEDEVEYCRVDEGPLNWKQGKLGEVRAPNGQLVEKTGVYGEVSYSFRGIWGLTVPARKGKLVDVAGED